MKQIKRNIKSFVLTSLRIRYILGTKYLSFDQCLHSWGSSKAQVLEKVPNNVQLPIPIPT